MNLTPLLSQLSEWMGVVAVAMIAGAGSRLRYRPLVFRYPRRELTISFILFGLITVMAFLFYSFRPQTTPGLNERFILAAICLAPFLVALRQRQQPIRSIGWNKETFRTAIMFGLALGILALFLRGKIFSIINGISLQEGTSLVILLAICLLEETIFRGYLQLRLVSAWGQWPGIFVTALLFTLWQIPLSLAQHLAVPVVLTNLALSLAQGIIVGFVMQKSGHVVAPGLYRAFSEWIILLV